MKPFAEFLLGALATAAILFGYLVLVIWMVLVAWGTPPENAVAQAVGRATALLAGLP